MVKRCKKLTKEQKKLVWSEPESNAGMGWTPKGRGEPVSRYPANRERDTEPAVDEVIKRNDR